MIIKDHQGNEVDLEVRYVESSNVKWVGWPRTGEDMMVVQFKSGRYAYLGASRQQAVAVANACAITSLESVGKYINRVIKPQYEVVKIG